MRLRGEIVLFQLSPEGKEALSGLLELKFRALVIEEDDLGLWISTQLSKAEAVQADSVAHDRPQKAIPVTLLKREYFSTAELDIDAETLADLTATEST